MKTLPEVDEDIDFIKQWKEETRELRRIMLDCSLTEEYKWENPAYSFNGTTVTVLQSFKNYCAILFLKGVLLKDPDNVLTKTGKNTYVGRQIRFKSLNEIVEMEPKIVNIVKEAIEVEKKGLKVEPINNKEIQMPKELLMKFDEMPEFRNAFYALTPGRQRGYLFYFNAPKFSKTKMDRIEKYIDQIMDGIGLYDDYLANK